MEKKTNDEIIRENMDLIRRCIDCQFAKLDKQFKEDFHNDLIIWLSTYSNDKLNDAVENNHLNALITKMIQNQVFSKTSKFYRDYYRWQARTNDISDIIEGENGD